MGDRVLDRVDRTVVASAGGRSLPASPPVVAGNGASALRLRDPDRSRVASRRDSTLRAVVYRRAPTLRGSRDRDRALPRARRADHDGVEPRRAAVRFRDLAGVEQSEGIQPSAAAQFVSNGANLVSSTFRPMDVVKAGCKRELIGVGACHVHGPHIYLGLPLPPCPKCGWRSVEGKHLKVKWYLSCTPCL